MGHTFVARLASNPKILVDSFTLRPTEIHDCPSLKQQKPIVTQTTLIEAKGIQGGIGNSFNVTNLKDVLLLNATNGGGGVGGVVMGDDGVRATGSE